MKIIVTTCNEYLHILRGFIYMFNKHWSSDAEVTILGYNPPAYDLPDNFRFISLGKQEEYGREWTTALIPYFKQMTDEYFILLLDDFYILNINKPLLHKAENYMINGIEKIHLTSLDDRVFNKEKDINFYFCQDIKYRLILPPSFIRRDYFFKYLVPGKNTWKYERNYKIAKNDGAQILITKQDIVSYSNFTYRGRVNPTQMSKIGKEDLCVLKQLGVF